MEKEKKEKLVLAGGLIGAIALGLTLEYVKIPCTSQTVTIEKIPVQNLVVLEEKGTTNYEFALPEGYTLGISEDGNPYGYKEIPQEEVIEVSLGNYLNYAFKKK